MDSNLLWQIEDLEQKFREIEPRTALHPEARELCTEALTRQFPELRRHGQAGSNEQATMALLNIWHTYQVVNSRIAETEKVRHLINEALNRAVASLLAGQRPQAS